MHETEFELKQDCLIFFVVDHVSNRKSNVKDPYGKDTHFTGKLKEEKCFMRLLSESKLLF